MVAGRPGNSSWSATLPLILERFYGGGKKIFFTPDELFCCGYAPYFMEGFKSGIGILQRFDSAKRKVWKGKGTKR